MRSLLQRSLFVLLFLALGAATARAQVWTEPEVASLDRPVTVYFDASQGNRGLEGYGGDVYAHTGVVTSASGSDTEWRYVKTNWGQNTPETRLERVSANVYRLLIPDIRAYYGVPAGEEIRRMTFVFRSADATREGKTSSWGDFFVDVVPEAVQVVWTEPSLPLVGGPITVFFDAAQGTRGLADFAGEVYAHTGVVTSAGSSNTEWRYVKTNWGQNTAETRLERIEPNVYRLRIDDVRAYYGVPANEEIRRLAFVFRSADGSRVGKGPGDRDLFIDVFSGEPALHFVSPEPDPLNPFITARDVTLDVVGRSPVGTTLRLYVDDVLVRQVFGTEIRYGLVLDEPGERAVRLEGDYGGEAVVRSFRAIRTPEIEERPRPAGLQDGITYHADGGVSLSLFAPFKEFAYVLGDFTEWNVRPEFFMNRETAGADSAWFWITLEGLEAGQEYGFQYLVDGKLRVADPYVEKVLQPEDEELRELGLYPGLQAYPTGETDYAVGVLQPGAAEYAFTVTDFERPDPSELVVYELLIRDFLEEDKLGGRTFYQALTDTLGYLQRLGVNAVELMPVAEYDGNRSWGYNPAFHFAPDKYYGPADHLKQFVDEAHRRGMAVILDVVYNHATGASPLVRLWNDGRYGGAYGEPTAQNPYANPEARHPFNVFSDLNHESAATQYWLDRANRHWLAEFNVDGYRFDLSKGFMQTGDFFQVNPGRIALLKRMADAIWAADPDAYVILEHLGEDEEERQLAAHGQDRGLDGMLLWGNMNHAYNEATMGYHENGKSDFSRVHHARRGFTGPNLVGYMESHDEQWMMFKNRSYAACENFPLGGPECETDPGDYSARELGSSLERMQAAGAFFLTIPGPKMIWQFGELGYGYGDAGEECLKPGGDSNGDCAPSAPGRTDEKPIRWDYYADPQRRALYDTWADLLAVRNEYEVFTSPETEVHLDLGGALKTIGLTHPTMSVFIAGNFGVAPETVQPPVPETGTWLDAFREEGRRSIGRGPITLAPGEFRLFTNRPLKKQLTKRSSLLAEAGLKNEALPTETALEAAYPNPFSGTATIRYALPKAEAVRLEVYDALGRRVAVLVDGQQPAGSHVATLDGADLPSGLYICRFQAGGQTFTRTLVRVQ